MGRFLDNLFTTRFALRRAFPSAALDDIEVAVKNSESTHSGEIRFVIETALDVPTLLRRIQPRDRAVELFSGLGIWDTAGNNGVLVYVLLAERAIEIVADRGYDELVSTHEWHGVCETMRADFVVDRFREGALAGVAGITAIIARCFGPDELGSNELEDRPTIL